jgi:hypothetical protein
MAPGSASVQLEWSGPSSIFCGSRAGVVSGIVSGSSLEAEAGRVVGGA